MNSANDSLPSMFLSICRNILSVRFSGVDSSSGIFITEPTILYIAWKMKWTLLYRNSLRRQAHLKLIPMLGRGIKKRIIIQRILIEVRTNFMPNFNAGPPPPDECYKYNNPFIRHILLAVKFKDRGTKPRNSLLNSLRPLYYLMENRSANLSFGDFRNKILKCTFFFFHFGNTFSFENV